MLETKIFRLARLLVLPGLLIVCGLFLFSKPAFAVPSLTNPALVASGSQYGQLWNLGGNDTTGDVLSWNTYPDWKAQGQHQRKMVALKIGGADMLFAAFADTGTCTDDTTVPVGTKIRYCPLQFRVSTNSGKTWAQAISGSVTTVNLSTGKQAGNATPPYDFNYTLHVGPDGTSIWVAYRGIRPLEIQQLTFNSSTGLWTFGPAFVPRSAAFSGDTPQWGNANYVGGLPVVFIQSVSSDQRIWTVYSRQSGNTYNNYLVYCDYNVASKPCTNASEWKDGESGSTWFHDNSSIPNFPITGPDPRVTFVAIGNNRALGIAYGVHRGDSGSPCNVSPGLARTSGMFFMTQKDPANLSQGWNNYNPTNFVNAYPYDWANSCGAYAVLGASGSFPFGYSVTTVATSATGANLMIAYMGGVNNEIAGAGFPANQQANQGKLFVKECTVNYSTGTVTCSSGLNPVSVGPYNSASIGVYNDGTGDQTWVAAQTGAGSLTTFSQTIFSTGPWTQYGPFAAAGTAYNPSVPEYVKFEAGNVPQSQLPPIIWSTIAGTKLQYSTNVAGTTIGTTPAYDSYPIFGWGWAPNFGLLSLNCSSVPYNSSFPQCGTIYGMGVSLNATADAGLTDEPTYSPVNNLYTVGGYAYSPNLGPQGGFVSFERRDTMSATNTGGNPPGQAYSLYGGAAANTSLAKYDPTTQHVWGWGRFLNLCNYNATTKKCQNDTAGWLRMRGYYTDPAKTATLNLASTGSSFTLRLNSCLNFPGSGVAMLNKVVFSYSSCSGVILTSSTPAPFYPPAANVGVKVYNVTGQGYGVDAYWTGSNYQLYGWAWSDEYGWVRFKPLLFLGYAWLETLFGNIYSGADVNLPSPQRANGDNVNKCGSTHDQPCYVSTYKIESNGTLSNFQYPGSSAVINPASSELGTSCNYSSGTPSGLCANILGSLSEQSAIQQLIIRSSANPPYSIGFPSVSPSATSYRNVLGKIDIQRLGLYPNTQTPAYTYGQVAGKLELGYAKTTNYYGDDLYLYNRNVNTNNSWTACLLNGTCTWTAPGVCGGGASCSYGLQKLQHQVVHVQGNFVVGADVSGGEVLMQTTYTSLVGTTLTVASTANFPQYGGTVVVDGGTSNEEYLSYTAVSGSTFTGVKTITGSKTHTGSSLVRWAWRVPYTDCPAGNCKAQTATVIVDGDLKIQYNITTADPRSDADILSASPTPTTIRDLPTIAFIVKGNVVVDPRVTNITGAYIVTGNDSSKTPGGSAGGVLSTGNDYALCNQVTRACSSLNVIGMLMARQFTFERYGNLNLDAPGEMVTSDERLYLNPPPGLDDLTKALPNPQQTTP